MNFGYMYILLCCDGTYYTGSTKDITLRVTQHESGVGAQYTARRLPVLLVYYEQFTSVQEAFYREKQVQGWSRRKKEALINGEGYLLSALAKKVFRKG